ncbi:hypothetical protein [Vogesella indigofera]|uniref:hypothetical protein n=1 Tax=Vogesella indigofera TaxID=45465 RepID=UPI00234E4DD5|nr:hypothetical protein [Vogesella indigofera]MDC7701623.1 hypothetical protein [Vogesella indigofera]
MGTQRGQNINDNIIKEIVGILDGWSGKLTWEKLIESIGKRLGSTYTRQALHQHERILLAFQLRKATLSEKTNRLSPAAQPRSEEEVAMLIGRNERLQTENARLKAENTLLLEQFVVWAYNAHTRGLTEEFLSRSLPAIDRDNTRAEPKQQAPKANKHRAAK